MTKLGLLCFAALALHHAMFELDQQQRDLLVELRDREAREVAQSTQDPALSNLSPDPLYLCELADRSDDSAL